MFHRRDNEMIRMDMMVQGLRPLVRIAKGVCGRLSSGSCSPRRQSRSLRAQVAAAKVQGQRVETVA